MLPLNGYILLSLVWIVILWIVNFAGILSNLLNARNHRQPVMKKKPITTDITRSILDIHNKKDANLKNLRIAALCSLAFAGRRIMQYRSEAY